MLEKLGYLQKKLVDLQKSHEPLKALSGNLNRMNSLLTICNKRLDNLDNKIASFSENNGKRKEPLGFENYQPKLAKTKDDNT